MKFTISYSRKVKSPKPYEMLAIFAAIEGDTGIESMDQTYEVARAFVEDKLNQEQARLRQKAHRKIKPGHVTG